MEIARTIKQDQQIHQELYQLTERVERLNIRRPFQVRSVLRMCRDQENELRRKSNEVIKVYETYAAQRADISQGMRMWEGFPRILDAVTVTMWMNRHQAAWSAYMSAKDRAAAFALSIFAIYLSIAVSAFWVIVFILRITLSK